MSDGPRQPEGLSADYWRLWGGSALSNLGDGVRITALPLLAAGLSRDPLAIGAVTAASFLPWILFSVPAGVVADRSDRRLLIVGGQIGRGLAVAGFAALVATGNQSLTAIYLIAIAIGLGEVLVDSAAQAAIPMLAPTGQLERANSRLIAVELLTNDVVGAPLGAWLFTIAAFAPFATDAVTFLGGALLVMGIRRPLQTPRTAGATSIRSDIAEGFRFLWRHPLLRGLVITVSLDNLAFTAATSLLVLLALDQLGLTEAGFGILVGIGALGGIAGSLAAQRLVDRFGRRAMLVVPTLASALALAVTGTASEPVTAGAGIFLVSGAVAIFNVVGRSLRQAVTPDRLLGRVVATFRLFGYAAIPLGSLGGGIFARYAGVPTTYVVAALVMVVAAIAMSRIVTPQRLEQAKRDSGR